MLPVRFHDLRQSGNTVAADTGASTRALRYQHMRGERYRLIADAMDAEMKKAQGKGRKRPPKQDPPAASDAQLARP